MKEMGIRLYFMGVNKRNQSTTNNQIRSHLVCDAKFQLLSCLILEYNPNKTATWREGETWHFEKSIFTSSAALVHVHVSNSVTPIASAVSSSSFPNGFCSEPVGAELLAQRTVSPPGHRRAQ